MRREAPVIKSTVFKKIVFNSKGEEPFQRVFPTHIAHLKLMFEQLGAVWAWVSAGLCFMTATGILANRQKFLQLS